jgi:hypothetical protein
LGSAFASASNDVVTDFIGFRKKTNNLFLESEVHLQTFYAYGNGLIVVIAGYLEQEYGENKNLVIHHDCCWINNDNYGLLFFNSKSK